VARRDGIRRGSRRNFSGLLITIALHGVIFYAVKTAHSHPEEPLIVPHDFVQAEMVKLGKPRDKFWLPKVHAAPPPPPPDAIKLSNDPNAKAAPVEAPKIEDPKTSKEVRRALERAQKLSALAVPPGLLTIALAQPLGPANLLLWGQRSDYTWYIRDGFFVRSPLKVNGVTVSEADRRKYESDFLKSEQERYARLVKKANISLD